MFSRFVPIAIVLAFPVVITYNSTKNPHEVFDRWKDRLEKEHPECYKSSGVDQGDVDDYWALIRIPSTKNFKCYLECMYRSFHFINDDGVINADQLVEDVENVTYDIVNDCNAERSNTTDRCEEVYDFFICVLHHHSVTPTAVVGAST
ncbi:hypothetical protein RI129_011035 [Pyrocoelia pectoralis]|uniref:Uncharacterized protein n=1 Tax=Pyrocoelia pectoralis TaxID=417401 RepID=A0AAN7V5H9_9COLE